MTEVVGLDKHGALGALACARAAEDEDDSDLVVVESRRWHCDKMKKDKTLWTVVVTRGHEGMICLSGLGRCRVFLLAMLDDKGKNDKGGDRESEEVPGIWTLSRKHTQLSSHNICYSHFSSHNMLQAASTRELAMYGVTCQLNG